MLGGAAGAWAKGYWEHRKAATEGLTAQIARQWTQIERLETRNEDLLGRFLRLEAEHRVALDELEDLRRENAQLLARVEKVEHTVEEASPLNGDG